MSSIHDQRYQRLIHSLITIRESKKITQVEVATCLQKPQSYVAKVENLDRRIDIIELIDWVRVLDLNVIEVLESSELLG